MKTVDAFRIESITSFENFVLSGTCVYSQQNGISYDTENASALCIPAMPERAS